MSFAISAGGGFVLAALLGWYFATRSFTTAREVTAPPPKKALLEIVATDFGVTLETTAHSWSVVVKNPTNADIHIENVQASCECQSVTPTTFTLGPGTQAEVRVTSDLTRRGRDGLDAKGHRLFSGNLRFRYTSNNESYDQQAKITGSVRDVLSFPTLSFQVSERSILATTFAALTTQVRSAGPTIQTITLKEPTPTGWHAVIRPNDDQQSWTITAQPTNPLPVGDYKVPLLLAITTPEGPVTRTIEWSGRIVDDIEMFPPTLAFTPTAVGKEVQESLSLRSRTGRALTIQRIDDV